MPVQIDPNTIQPVTPSLSVAQRLESWAMQRAKERTAKNMAAAQREGMGEEIERVDGKPVLKQEKVGFIGSKTTEAYNKGLRDAYVISVDRDNTHEVGRIAQESDGNLDQFDEVINKYRGTVLANVDPLVETEIKLSLDSMIGRARTKVQELGINRNIKNAKENRIAAVATYGDEASSLANMGDVNGAAENLLKLRASLQSLVEDGTYSQADADQEFDGYSRRTQAQQLKGEVYRLAEEDPQAAFKAIDEAQANRPDNFTPEQWESVIGEAMATVRETDTINQAANASRNIELEREISNLFIAAKTGQGEVDYITSRADQLFEDGSLTRNERTQIYTSVLNRQNKQRKNVADLQAVAQRLTTGDRSIVVDKSAIDLYYETYLVPHIEESGLPPDLVKANYVQTMRVLPKGMKQEISNGLTSENQDLIIESSNLIDMIDDVPGLTDEFSPEQRALAEQVVKLLPNMPPAQAVEKAAQITDPANRAMVDARMADLKERVQKKKIDYREEAIDTFDGLFGADVRPIDEGAITQEYQSLVEAHYQLGMTLDGARDTARKLMRTNWGEFDGYTMRHPPTKYYDVGGSAEWVKDDLRRFVKTTSFGGEFDDVFLVSDEVTQRTAKTGRPAYRIMLSTEDGLVPFINKGSKYGLGYWQPDIDGEIKKFMDDSKSYIKRRRKGTPGSDELKDLRSF